MPKRDIVKFEDERSQWIGYRDTVFECDKDKIIEDDSVFSLEELADLCDMKAESRNNHSHVGTHRLLAALLRSVLCREIATDIMLEIAEYGGLDGMVGWGGEPDAYADLGIKPPWNDWKLADKQQLRYDL